MLLEVTVHGGLHRIFQSLIKRAHLLHASIDDDLEDWRSEPGEIAAYAKAKAQGIREGLMRFAAEESRFTFEGDSRSWVAALEAAIVATGIELESEAFVV